MVTQTNRTTGFPPLTTVFTPPDSCLTRLPTRLPVGLWGDGPYPDWVFPQFLPRTEAAYERTECYPPGYREAPYEANSAFSPGICPSGWAIEGSTTTGSATFASCCPLSFSTFDFSSSRSWTIKCGVWISGPVVALDWDSNVTDRSQMARTSPSITVTISSTSILVEEFPINIMWEQKDLSVLAQATVTTDNNEPASGTTPRTATGTVNDANENSSTSRRTSTLNPGAIAAIALAAFILGVVILVALMLRRRRRKLKARAATIGAGGVGGLQAAELDAGANKGGIPELLVQAYRPAEELDSKGTIPEPSTRAHREARELLTHETYDTVTPELDVEAYRLTQELSSEWTRRAELEAGAP